MSIIEKTALFIDYKNNEQYARIRINEGIFVGINTFNLDNNPTGYMNVFFHPNKRLFLDTIYCYDQFRRYGLATLISELADYILKDYEGYVIRGVYEPGQLSTDRENNIERSQEELEMSARKFYEKNEYKIIDYDEYSKNKYKYPYIIDDDFKLGEEETPRIVAKQITQKDYAFYEDEGVIYHHNYNRSNIGKK